MAIGLITLTDLCIAGILLGANVWFFFVQSPVLVRTMGRDKFVPIQMRLTKVLFQLQAILGVIFVVVAGLAFGLGLALWGALASAIAAAACHFYVVPKALRAGGQGKKETAATGGDKSVGKFISEGTGPSATFWHRTVVFCVVVILAGVLVNLWSVI